MLYIYYGSSVSKVRAAAHEKARGLCDEGGDVTIITPDKATIGTLKDALGATSLFRTNEVFLLDSLSEDAELFHDAGALASLMASSQNHFVVIERSLLAAEKKMFSVHALTCTEYKEEKKDFNIFALTDALLARDKKTLWILVEKAWREGKTSEELIGTLWWQLKIMRLASCTKGAEEAGQKPFVYDKAKRALKNFKDGEVAQLSHVLLMLYHDGHGGKRNIDHAFETWVLGL